MNIARLCAIVIAATVLSNNKNINLHLDNGWITVEIATSGRSFVFSINPRERRVARYSYKKREANQPQA